MANDALQAGFLNELEALEKFRISYTAQYPQVPLSHDDPDIRRLIEAMAFFTARTRLAGMRSLDQSVQRIFRQHFPSLLGPTPAMAMLRATPGAQFADATQVPRGTEVLLKLAADETGEPERLFRFRTLAPLTVSPLRVTGVDLIPRLDGRCRFFIRLSANSAHNRELRSLALYINHLDELLSSMTVTHELRTHLLGASVHYEAKPAEGAPGQPCEVSIGPPADAERDDADPFQSPLQRARMRLRFPQSDLFIQFTGLRPPRNWQHITLCLELGAAWPRKLRLTSDTFELHTVPMLNVRRDLANPITCDGTKDRYPLRHPDESGHYAPLWVIGAYRPTKQGFVPLAPGVVGAEGDTYEVTTEGSGEQRRAWAMLHLRDAYQSPQLISVDAFWHQPGLRGVDSADLSVGLGDRFVDGVTWSCAGPIVQYADSAIDDDREAQLQLVSLKTQQFLGTEELRGLLRACGAQMEPHFSRIVSALSDVSVSDKPLGKQNGLKYVYELTFGVLDPSDLPRLAQFCSWLLDLLSSWSEEEVLEIMAKVPNLDKVMRYV
jgi:type VI secretion system protein ImpG